jgi:hypothetical protein
MGDWQSSQLYSCHGRRIHLTIRDFALPTVFARKIRGSEFEAKTSELYNDAGGNPALLILGLVAEFSHKPICLHQAKSDPFPKPDI